MMLTFNWSQMSHSGCAVFEQVRVLRL